jgi:hypothetical protein
VKKDRQDRWTTSMGPGQARLADFKAMTISGHLVFLTPAHIVAPANPTTEE